MVRSLLSEQVAEVMREQILTGRLRSGDKVVQSDWASRLGVSRMPVRDAISALCNEGLLSQATTGTAEVAPVDVAEMADVFRLNALVGALAARRAATRMTAEERAELERIHADLIAAVDDGDLRRASEANWALHRVVNRAARSPRLFALLRILSTTTPRTSFELIPEWAARAVDDHARLIDALYRSDADLAYEITYDHIASGTAPLVEQLEARFAGESSRA